MRWQDVAFTGCSLALAAGLWPLVRRSDTRVPLSASLPTATALSLAAGVDLTLGLSLTAATSALTAGAWWFMVLRHRP